MLTPAPFADDALNAFWDSGLPDATVDVGSLGTAADDVRFAYAGGRGTWTALHRDVAASHSWSASLRGAKLWIMFAPGAASRLGLLDRWGDAAVPDPRTAALLRLAAEQAERVGGTALRERVEAAWPDPGEAASPAAGAAAVEWSGDGAGPRVARGDAAVLVQLPGDVVFVPSAWAHAVYNVPLLSLAGDGTDAAGPPPPPGSDAPAPAPPLTVSVNANWVPGCGMSALAREVLRQSAEARSRMADCVAEGMVPAGPGADARSVDVAWEWHCQRVVRLSSRLDLPDVCRLVLARAGAATARLRTEAAKAGAEHHTPPGSDSAAAGADRRTLLADGAATAGAAAAACAWAGSPIEPSDPYRLLPGAQHDGLRARMDADAVRDAQRACRALAADPLLAWMLADTDAADAASRATAARGTTAELGGSLNWVAEAEAYPGARVLGLERFWPRARVAELGASTVQPRAAMVARK